MQVYTGTGDKGETSLASGERIKKHHPLLEAYGTLDELNSVIGYTRTLCDDEEMDRILEDVQRTLFKVGASLAGSKMKISEGDIKNVERLIDRYDAKLEPLHGFILPTGIPLASSLHMCRSVCRRAERRVSLLLETTIAYTTELKYLNRLSDLFFVMARYANLKRGMPDERV